MSYCINDKDIKINLAQCRIQKLHIRADLLVQTSLLRPRLSHWFLLNYRACRIFGNKYTVTHTCKVVSRIPPESEGVGLSGVEIKGLTKTICIRNV